jgi:hypothetical protein
VWRAFREDYFAVPDILARKKEFAEFFAKRWGRLVGPVQLVYARTPEGRRMLLRARVHSLGWRVPKTLGTCELLEVTHCHELVARVDRIGFFVPTSG